MGLNVNVIHLRDHRTPEVRMPSIFLWPQHPFTDSEFLSDSGPMLPVVKKQA